jgi:predicted ATPase/class 3 adenylate cyclase
MVTVGGPNASSDHEVDVVLLFTDIEDSTAKWEASSTSMSSALERHDEVLATAVEQFGGSRLKHTGDGVIAHFKDVPAAIGAAIESQRRFRNEDFSSVDGLRVRMGIHTGRAQERDGDLFGSALNQCGRVMSVAHGGQVVTTSKVAIALSEDYGEWCTASEVSLVDLGVHRFKGLSNPERLYQVSHPAIEGLFPSPRSLNAELGNLPAVLSTLIGRDELITDVSDLLLQPGIVTLTGPGGVGKTSIALHVARRLVDRFPDGTWIVDLSNVLDASGVGMAIAQTMGIAPRLGQSIEETLRDAFGVRRALVVLDNAERPRQGTALSLNQVIAHGSLVRILATSFSSTGVAGEVRVRVDPLGSPQDVDLHDPKDAQRWPALELFVERARVASPDFELTEQNLPYATSICEHLDGLPLAIELAAARAELLSLEQIDARLSRRFQLLQLPVGNDHRHRALSATLEWSVELLSPDAMALFLRLGSLATSFDLATACAIADGDELDVLNQLSELAANSMLLIESTRLFAAERLEQEPHAGDVWDLHASYFAQRAAEMRRLMWGQQGLAMVDYCYRALPDFRRAFERSLDVDVDVALKIISDLYALWILRDLPAEGTRWLAEVVDAGGGLDRMSPTSAMVSALDDVGTLAWMIGEQGVAERYLVAAIDMAAGLGVPSPPKALVRLGTIRMMAGDVVEGRRMCRLASELSKRSDAETQVAVERSLGAVRSMVGDREEGAAICRAAVVRARQSDLWLASALTNLAWACYVRDPAAARDAAREAVDESTRIGSVYYLGSAWSALALASSELGETESSLRAWAEAVQKMLDVGAKSNVLLAIARMSDTLFDFAPAIAITLAAGAARQPGPGADGTWLDHRFEALKRRAGASVAADAFDVAWKSGASLSIDALVRLARSSIDELFA